MFPCGEPPAGGEIGKQTGGRYKEISDVRYDIICSMKNMDKIEGLIHHESEQRACHLTIF